MRENTYTNLKGPALQRLSEIACTLKDSTASNETLVEVIDTIKSFERVPNLIRPTGAGTINELAYDVSVGNSGTSDGVVLGEAIKPGETLNFNAGSLNNFYPAGTFTYDGTGTELVIIYNS